MFSERLKQLGLEEIIKKRKHDEAELAAMLRKLTCDYLAGKLKGVITDGPNVIAMREFIDSGVFADRGIKSVSDFVAKQSKNGIWEGETTFVLAELLGCDIALTTDKSLKNNLAPSTWGGAKNDKPVITLCNNDNNTHWQAVIRGKKVNVKGDGNCFYRAAAVNIMHLDSVQQKLAQTQPVKSVKSTPLVGEKETEMTAQKAVQAAAIPAKNEEKSDSNQVEPIDTKEQIEKDYKYALELANQELKQPNQKIEAIVKSQQLLFDFFSKKQAEKSSGETPRLRQ